MKSIRFTLASLLFAALALLTPARAAIDLESIKPDGFAHGVVFTVDEYAKTEDRATLTNFTVLVRISTGISGFNYADSLVSEGGDIRFADANGDPLPPEYRDHALIGNYQGVRECHIRPDWLLIYKINENVLVLELLRTGSHSDLFR